MGQRDVEKNGMHMGCLLHKRGAPCTRGPYGTSPVVSARSTRFSPLLRACFLAPRVAAPVLLALSAVGHGCVPAGNSTPSDSGTGGSSPVNTPVVKQSPNVLRAVFEDNFDRPNATAPSASSSSSPVESGSAAASALASASAAPSPSGSAAPRFNPLGPNWYEAQTSAWRIENGHLCGQNAHNHGVWLQKPIPINARIEFDAVSDGPDGDLKAEVWGDGQSSATSQSYTNATSYLAIFGGWKNTFHVLARINEHGSDRKEIKIDPDSDDPRQKPVTGGQHYHFKIERTDGKTVKWSVDGLEYLNWQDATPLAGIGHDHFGFNDWEVKVCFDNVKVTPL